MSDFHLNTSKNIEVFSSVSERITQLSDLKTTLDEILAILKKVRVCSHIAIRIFDSKGNIPFYSHLGLEKEFLDSEHWVTVKDCFCGYVARGKVDKTLPFISSNGSFFTSSMSKLMAHIGKDYSQMNKVKFRNVCFDRGYESIALIPIKMKGKIIGELYLSDEKKGLFSLEKIRFLEKLGIQIGIAIQNAQLYTELEESQKRLMELFNSATVGIIELDTKGSIVQINDTGAKLFGYSSPLLLIDHGIKINDLQVEEEEWEKFLERVDTAAYGESHTLVFQVGKEKQYLEFSLSFIKDTAGNITGYRGTFQDITDRFRLEEERLNKVRAESLKKRYYKEVLVLKDEIKSKYPFEEMIGTSKAMQRVKNAIQQVAPTDTTVLIKGETGTGKELVARYIHELSLRKDRLLVKVNCAALSEGLIASELFGHEKGAFTGAIQRRMGRFEYADKATVFLDEIGDLPLDTQAMLLRVLQSGEFERVGSSKTIKVDVRLLAASNRDLNLLVEENKFRQDLFFRLNVFPIEISPLREKKEDISLLTAYFLEIFGRKTGKKIDKIKKETLQHFMEYTWPGNVRELQNIIEHGLVISKGEYLEVAEAYFDQEPNSKREIELESLQEHEKKYINDVLRRTKGVIYGPRGASRILGLKPSTLQSRMKKLSIKKI